jgi:hypothetical protein
MRHLFKSALLLPPALLLAAAVWAGTRPLLEPCCNVVGIDAAKGSVSIRNRFTGRLMQIKDASLAAELKLGDAVDADGAMRQITMVKGAAKTAALIEPDGIEPCCSVVAVVKDKAAMEALLGAMFAEPVGNPAEPVNDIRGKARGAAPINDIVSKIHGAEPISGIVVATNTTTGALHVLNLSVADANSMEAVSAPITSGVKIGDPVYLDPVNGIGMMKSAGETYAFNLRGIKKTAEPVGAKGPWVIEPNPEMKGRFGRIVTKWHEKTSSGHEAINVYLPGTDPKTGKAEYTEYWKTDHDQMEGEYDVSINGAMLKNLPVKAGHNTRILMGALRSTAAWGNILYVHDVNDKEISSLQGTEVLALPIGTYHLKVGTRMVPIVISEDELIEF